MDSLIKVELLAASLKHIEELKGRCSFDPIKGHHEGKFDIGDTFMAGAEAYEKATGKRAGLKLRVENARLRHALTEVQELLGAEPVRTEYVGKDGQGRNEYKYTPGVEQKALMIISRALERGK